MLVKVYKNINSKEEVTKAEALEYVLEKLGITLEGKGKFDTFTQEQIEFQTMLVDWYFSGNWVEEIIDTNNQENDEYAEKQDRIYQDEVDKKLGL